MTRPKTMAWAWHNGIAANAKRRLTPPSPAGPTESWWARHGAYQAPAQADFYAELRRQQPEPPRRPQRRDPSLDGDARGWPERLL